RQLADHRLSPAHEDGPQDHRSGGNGRSPVYQRGDGRDARRQGTGGLNIALVPPQNVDAVWQHIAEMVSNGMDQITADCTAGDLWTLCRSGQVYLVIAHEQEPVAASFWRFEMWP